MRRPRRAMTIATYASSMRRVAVVGGGFAGLAAAKYVDP